MPKQFMHVEDHLAMLNEYAPHRVSMQLVDSQGVQPDFLLVGVDFSERLVLTSVLGGSTQSWHVSEAQPVLYSLADLPNLSGGDGRDYASPCATIIHALNFIQRGDYGSGEWVSQITVKSASDAQLHLAFSTSYTPLEEVDPTVETHLDDDIDPEADYYKGADYEVTIAATGTVHWRNVTADELDTDSKSRQHWRIAEGANVFEAFTMLRRLHVAVGRAAHVHYEFSSFKRNEWNQATRHYSYVRKLLPVAEQKGGQRNG